MALSDVYHQPRAQRLLQRAIERQRLPHAYVFQGPDGVGKERLAVGLAQFLLCESSMPKKLTREQADSVGCDVLHMGCGACEDCRAVAVGTHPDLHLIYRQLNRQHPDSTVRQRKALDIGVDVLRYFVIGCVGHTPLRGRAKVFIIREADRITTQAQNALLKTLEEPPGTTFIILLAASDQLLPTTLSRCQVVPFDALPQSFVAQRIATLRPQMPKEAVQWYARWADGSLGRAIQGADDDLFQVHQRLGETLGSPSASRPSAALTKRWLDESENLADRARKRDPDITDTEAGRRGLQTLFQLAAQFYALRLRGAVDAQPAGDAPSVPQRRRSLEAVTSAIRRLALAENQLDLNANAQLCLETLLNDLNQLTRRSPVAT